MANRKKKSSGLMGACWILILLVLVIAFFVKKDTITSNLKNSDFFNKVFGTTPKFIQEHKDKEKPADDIQKQPEIVLQEEVTGSEVSKIQIIEEEASFDENVSGDSDETEKAVVEKAQETEAEKKTEKTEQKTEAENKVVVKKYESTIYFVVIDSDGSVTRKAVKRSMNKSDSPLTDSINELLKGPALEDKNKNCMSLIPEGTKLLGASVRNGTATLNFSENFEFNSFGVEGYIAQLMQIVYTATEFSTVKNVQFLIEGEKKDYIGSEGQWIGSPLARTSF